MLKVILSIILLSAVAFAKSLVFDVCTPLFCYQVVTPDAKSWEWKQDDTGNRFVRIYLFDGVLDISHKNASIKARK